jgi:translation initiation factor IF-1
MNMMGAGLCGLVCSNHVTQVAHISVQVEMVVWITYK